MQTAPRPYPNGSGSRHNGASSAPAAAVLRLPFEAILLGLPIELHPRHARRDVTGQTIPVPLEIILPQLSRGIVRISFGDLRKGAPHLFAPESDLDNLEVVLPLAEILSRLNPGFLLRRRSQKMVEVPEDVGSPFGPQGRFLAGPRATPPPETPPETPPEPQPQAAPGVSRHRPGLLNSVPPPVAKTLLSPRPNSAVPAIPSCPAPAAPALSPPGLIAMPSSDRPVEPVPEPMPVLQMPVAPPAQAAQPLAAALAALAQAWPEAVRAEILRLGLLDAKLALPAHTIEQALKQGRVAFSWKAVRSWIRPAIAPATSPEDNTVLELPLAVVAPLFLARQRQAGEARQKVTIDESIPNLFLGAQPEHPPSTRAHVPAPAPGHVAAPAPGHVAAPAQGQESNYYVWEAGAEPLRMPQPQAEPRPNPASGTRFIAKYATPNEIVSRAAALDNVAGALIGLPDGLLVASRLGSDLNADTLAAFLPQIFGRVSQSTKELRMGELNELGFTVGSTPWRLFRVNAIFFAAFGRPGQPLPGTELAALAAELDHKPR